MQQKERIATRNKIEDELIYRLDNIIEKIKGNGINDVGIAQRYYSNQVNQTMRASAEDAYQLGVEYVTSKKKVVGFLSSFDTEIIKKQVDKYALRFWLNVGQVIHRNDILLQKYNYEPRSELNSNYMATKIAIALVTTTMAIATKTKALVFQSNKLKSAAVKKCPKGKHWDIKRKKCVDDDVPPLSALPIPPAEDFLSPTLALASFFLDDGEYEVPVDEVETEQIVLVWNAILDDRTCLVCESLDGSRWSPDDPDLPTPGDDGDIHYNCRCFWDMEVL